MKLFFPQLKNINAEISLAGDKSVSHRAVIFASMAKGTSEIENCSAGEDVKSTIECFKNLGVKIEKSNNNLIIHGVGRFGFKPPLKSLYAGNSGTTARLLAGLLATQKFNSTITGDSSLSIRPMKRLLPPLSLLGGNLKLSNSDTLPLEIYSSNKLHHGRYFSSTPSAQVKSAFLLSALNIDEISSYIETVPTRNHTEIMLDLNLQKIEPGVEIFVSSINYPVEGYFKIPGDISSAAFFIVLAILIPSSTIKISGVLLNPSRIAFIEILKEMGASIEVINKESLCNEISGDIIVRSSVLKNVRIKEEIISSIIDEIPILAVAGAFAEGEFLITGASELRVKESDRIESICKNFINAGMDVEIFQDGFRIKGRYKAIKEVNFQSFGDHRIAMAFAVYCLVNEKGGFVDDIDSSNISNPGFLQIISTFY
ncbi:MAG: 3-phosphoshikimate 1-carboxyvinyltransferase [Ignavibacteriaceae bacterium]|nr:3-phosphoshikimate 1-carboxyvinyltransferase [Ignavibacteriaceae bacterium]